MHDFARRCSSIAQVFSIGKSGEGRDLWALEIATNPGLEQAKPRAKYVANMHGDEPSGRYEPFIYSDTTYCVIRCQHAMMYSQSIVGLRLLLQCEHCSNKL